MKSEVQEGISEVLDILNHMDKTYVQKIPKNFMEFLKKNKSSNYSFNLDHSKKLNEMELKKETKYLLALIYMKYWSTQEQKSVYKNRLKYNEELYQTKLREKYNPNYLFKKN